MFGDHFYHETIKRAVSVFGTLFNNLSIKRADGTLMKVPLAYGPRSKWIARLQQQTALGIDGTPRTAISLPRMGFEMTSIEYDPTRKITKKTLYKKAKSSDPTRMQYQYSPAPYNIGFQLNVYAKSQDDATQIVEQILPTFNPQYTLTIKPFATEYPTWKEDIPIIIQGLALQDDFEGAVEQRRTIIYQLDFEMKLNFYGEIGTSSIIRTATNKFFQMGVGLADSDIHLETMTITPTPVGVSADSDFGFNTVIDLVFDSV